MPVRSKAVMDFARAQTGGLSFNNIEMVARLGPLDSRVTIDRDDYEDRYDRPWAYMVDRVDWNRVLLEATVRHLRRQGEDEGHRTDDYGDEICPECLCDALLARRHWEGGAETLDRGSEKPAKPFPLDAPSTASEGDA